jgi:hypothetical protein
MLEPNPSLLKWNGPVGPGKTSCGFLQVPLSYSQDLLQNPFPQVARPAVGLPRTEVYFCTTFSTENPEIAEPLFVHCGGPGSLSNCVDVVRRSHSEAMKRKYNFVAVDQRGMGNTALKTGLNFDLCNGFLGAVPRPGYDAYTFPERPENQILLQNVYDANALASQNCWNLPVFNIKNPNVSSILLSYGRVLDDRACRSVKTIQAGRRSIFYVIVAHRH